MSKPKRCIFCHHGKKLFGLSHYETGEGVIMCRRCIRTLGYIADMDTDLEMFHFEAITRFGQPREYQDAVKSVERQLKGKA